MPLSVSGGVLFRQVLRGEIGAKTKSAPSAKYQEEDEEEKGGSGGLAGRRLYLHCAERLPRAWAEPSMRSHSPIVRRGIGLGSTTVIFLV